MTESAVVRRIGHLILILGPITTLLISPFSSYDPINLIKLLAVVSISFGIMGLIFSQGLRAINLIAPSLLWTSVSFIAWLFVVFFTSGAPLNQQFWGAFGRGTGLLTYLSLIFVLIGSSLISNVNVYQKIVFSIVWTSIPVTIYALIQSFGKDPIQWSVMQPFATLGNINFSSAFFGLASICSTAIILSKGLNTFVRIGLAALIVTDLVIVYQTGSIQGIMIYFAGLGVIIYFLLRGSSRLSSLQYPYLILGLVVFALTSLGLKNIGPMSRFVFGDTVLYRFDYWFAGWAMTLRSPIIGLGMDSYGDWYRETRGEIATLRTIPDRITNTAHNIYLDISSSGGFPLLILYLFILFIAGRAAIRLLRSDRSFDPVFVALFAAWIAYLIQAAISINQIGVGIWGWIFTGAIIGYERAKSASTIIKKEAQSKGSTSKSKQANNSGPRQLPAKTALTGLATFAVGFSLAFLPFNADREFRRVIASGSAEATLQSARQLGATASHYERALDLAMTSGDSQIARVIADEILEKYPRNFMAWRVKQVLVDSSLAERIAATEKLKELDPYNNTIPEVQP